MARFKDVVLTHEDYLKDIEDAIESGKKDARMAIIGDMERYEMLVKSSPAHYRTPSERKYELKASYSKIQDIVEAFGKIRDYT